MRFEEFAEAHGLILRAVDYGKWIRCATKDHPGKKNGAFKHLGDVAWVQNHATMVEPATWFPDAEAVDKVDHAAIERRKQQAAKQVQDGRAKAARNALAILSECAIEQHAYLDGKGFPETTGLVYRPTENQNLLVIPMRVGSEVVGLQMIDRDGVKKFLFGQRCGQAEHIIGAKGLNVWVEGYATGLSVVACLAALKKPARVHVCFSAGNLEAMARDGVVVADNDQSGTGERVAKATGLPYFMPENIGEDFNDLHQKIGTFRASQLLRVILMR